MSTLLAQPEVVHFFAHSFNHRNPPPPLWASSVHAQDQNPIHHILRAFDFDPSYGPSLGMTRLQRWKRAKDLGEDPPEEVYEILTTKEGKLMDEYREACLTVMGV